MLFFLKKHYICAYKSKSIPQNIIFMNILLTGGAGFIGSHTIIELDKAGHSVVVVDNLVNSKPEALRRVAKIIGKEVPFVEADVRDRDAMEKVFTENKIDAVINFAGLKAVGESVAKPLEYYENNMNGVFVLVDVMRKHGCKNFKRIFLRLLAKLPAHIMGKALTHVSALFHSLKVNVTVIPSEAYPVFHFLRHN